MTAVAERAGTRAPARAAMWTVYRCELGKLAAQVKTQAAVGMCVLAPFLFVAALSAQSSTPQDTLFGRWVHTSGFAVPLVVLGFSAQWAFPVLTCIVAGDIFSAEDRHGTWKTILTRSRSRGQIFAAKALAAATYAVVVVVLLAGSSLAAGVLLIGHQPLVGLSGSLLQPGHCTALVLLSWATVLPPALGFGALGTLLSIATRSSVVGVGGPLILGLLMQIASLGSGAQAIQAGFLTTPFLAWHGLFTTPQFHQPILRGVIVSACWLLVCLGAAYALLRRRDVRWS